MAKMNLKEFQPRVWKSITGFRWCCQSKENDCHLVSCGKQLKANSDSGKAMVAPGIVASGPSSSEEIEVRCPTCQELSSNLVCNRGNHHAHCRKCNNTFKFNFIENTIYIWLHKGNIEKTKYVKYWNSVFTSYEFTWSWDF